MSVSFSLLNIGHRGSPLKSTENTIDSFQLALDQGAQGFECDIRLSSDHEMIVFHDDSLERLLQKKISIEALSLKEIQNLRYEDGQRPCRLQDVLDRFTDCVINLEIKKSALANFIHTPLIQLLKRQKKLDRFLISSFSPEILADFHQHASHQKLSMRLGFIFYEFNDSTQKFIADADWLYSLHPHHKLFSQINELYQKPLWVWTPNEESEWKNFIESPGSLEALITDNPRGLTDFLRLKNF
jgi:glycerophosphoryl diester phosphodiesterase